MGWADPRASVVKRLKENGAPRSPTPGLPTDREDAARGYFVSGLGVSVLDLPHGLSLWG